VCVGYDLTLFCLNFLFILVIFVLSFSKFQYIFKSIENDLPFKAILAKDREHSLIIAKKIIDKQDNQLWRENSHSYCYIVLRAVFYIYFKEFVKSYGISRDDDDITLFICKYFPKIISKLKKIKDIKKGNSIKQTIFNNF
jgi:hypothetical protein